MNRESDIVTKRVKRDIPTPFKVPIWQIMADNVPHELLGGEGRPAVVYLNSEEAVWSYMNQGFLKEVSLAGIARVAHRNPDQIRAFFAGYGQFLDGKLRPSIEKEDWVRLRSGEDVERYLRDYPPPRILQFLVYGADVRPWEDSMEL